ncbi:hypothetical protein AB6Q56_12855 [Dechloromonas sp. ARDL1]|uniref:hypothetical protein n=1 Tax=Dechloromonas sp. ARDL1 TaxID=3322121 RepID=UPI003DA74D23
MSNHLQNRQQGVILLSLMIVLLLTSGFYLIKQSSSIFSKSAQASVDASVLQLAQEALLARAISDGNRPGSLPCPALTSDGNAPGLPPCPSFVGWLPWRTLNLNDPRDSSGERLWYVLAPAFQDIGIINTNSTSTLTLDGASGIAALIIAPGAALAGQNRPSNSITDYLDNKDGNAATSNNDGDDSYFSAPSDEKFNDKVLPLATSTLFAGVAKRVLGEIRYAYSAASAPPPFADTNDDGISDSGQDLGRFPYKNALYAIQSPSWYSASPPFHLWYDSLVNNGWFPLVTYDRSTRSISLNGQVLVLP